MPLESPLAYIMYLFNLRIANHILKKIVINKEYFNYYFGNGKDVAMSSAA